MKTKVIVAITSMLGVLAATTAMGGFPELPVNLGEAGHFTILAGSAITSAGGDIYGDAGVSPAAGSTIGLDPAQMKDGVIYATVPGGPAGSVVAPVMLTTAQADLTTAFGDAAGRTFPDTTYAAPGELGGLTLSPGLYKFTSTAQLTGSDLTLSGGASDVWIFQVATALTVGTYRKVLLSGGALAKNVFWQVGSSAELNTYCDFKGTIMADQHIVLGVGSKLEGRALARIAHVVFDGESALLPLDAPPPGMTNVTLTVISEHGTGSSLEAGLPPAGKVHTNAYGTVLNNSISGQETIGGTQYVNTGWSMVGNTPFAGSTNVMGMVHTNDAVLTWLWSTNYLLSASADPGGSIMGDTNGFYAADSGVSVTAVAAPGATFTGWTGNVSGSTNAATQNLTMDQARTLVAHFMPTALGCGTPVTVGAFMELDLSAMFPGAGWTYSALSTEPAVMSAAITPENRLRLEALDSGVTLITVDAVGPGGSATNSFPVSVVGHPYVVSMEMTPREPWNPRFEQRIVVLNDTGIACPAKGLRLLFSDIQPGIVIENQTGLTPAPDGRPMLEWSLDFPDGATQALSVIYLGTGAFRPDEHPPTVEVQYILANAPLVPAQEGVPNIESIRVLADGRVVLEFASVVGSTYAIDHAPTPTGVWATVSLRLQAGANRTQWIDYGPPATPPLADARFYRVREVAP